MELPNLVPHILSFELDWIVSFAGIEHHTSSLDEFLTIVLLVWTSRASAFASFLEKKARPARAFLVPSHLSNSIGFNSNATSHSLQQLEVYPQSWVF